MDSTAKRYPAIDEKTTLKDRPTLVSCLKSDTSVFVAIFLSEITDEFILPRIFHKDI